MIVNSGKILYVLSLNPLRLHIASGWTIELGLYVWIRWKRGLQPIIKKYLYGILVILGLLLIESCSFLRR